MTEIAGLVAFDLRPPPLAARFWQAEVGTVWMPVPEAAVDEYNRAVFRQHKIRATG